MYALRPRDMQKSGANVVFVDESIFPQTLAVMTTRAIPQGIQIRTGKYSELELTPDIFACILQYPNASGNAEDYRAFVESPCCQLQSSRCRRYPEPCPAHPSRRMGS